jgi:hypothetical protein
MVCCREEGKAQQREMQLQVAEMQIEVGGKNEVQAVYLIRKDAKVEKSYLLGRYGAIPVLKGELI